MRRLSTTSKSDLDSAVVILFFLIMVIGLCIVGVMMFLDRELSAMNRNQVCFDVAEMGPKTRELMKEALTK